MGLWKIPIRTATSIIRKTLPITTPTTTPFDDFAGAAVFTEYGAYGGGAYCCCGGAYGC
jgi:hypothetical protein